MVGALPQIRRRLSDRAIDQPIADRIQHRRMVTHGVDDRVWPVALVIGELPERHNVRQVNRIDPRAVLHPVAPQMHRAVLVGKHA